ncbi:Bifunctional transcriptional activator/DNA repair enzyme AdaA [compost metagenome]
MTLSEYLAGRRIREACALLENTDTSIREIGRIVGGFSAPYFSQLFKKHKGLTPNSYRKAVKEIYSKN